MHNVVQQPGVRMAALHGVGLARPRVSLGNDGELLHMPGAAGGRGGGMGLRKHQATGAPRGTEARTSQQAHDPLLLRNCDMKQTLWLPYLCRRGGGGRRRARALFPFLRAERIFGCSSASMSACVASGPKTLLAVHFASLAAFFPFLAAMTRSSRPRDTEKALLSDRGCILM